MERNKKKNETRKVFVRNPEAPKPKTIVIKGSDETATTKLSKSFARFNLTENNTASGAKPTTSKSTPNIELNSAQKIKDSSSNPNFDLPELNSALRIKERIKSLATLKHKNMPDKKTSVITEEAAKQVNFPLDKPVFKGLVPLGVVKKKEILPERHFVRRAREKEPVLSDFYTPTTFPEEPVLLPLQRPELGKMRGGFDRLRLYKIMQTWKVDDIV